MPNGLIPLTLAQLAQVKSGTPLRDLQTGEDGFFDPCFTGNGNPLRRRRLVDGRYAVVGTAPEADRSSLDVLLMQPDGTRLFDHLSETYGVKNGRHFSGDRYVRDLCGGSFSIVESPTPPSLADVLTGPLHGFADDDLECFAPIAPNVQPRRRLSVGTVFWAVVGGALLGWGLGTRSGLTLVAAATSFLLAWLFRPVASIAGDGVTCDSEDPNPNG